MRGKVRNAPTEPKKPKKKAMTRKQRIGKAIQSAGEGGLGGGDDDQEMAGFRQKQSQMSQTRQAKQAATPGKAQEIIAKRGLK